MDFWVKNSVSITRVFARNWFLELGFFLGKSIANSSEDLLFLFPKKLKLPEDKPINQKENLIKWQYQKKVQNGINKASLLYTEEVKNGVFNK